MIFSGRNVLVSIAFVMLFSRHCLVVGTEHDDNDDHVLKAPSLRLKAQRKSRRSGSLNESFDDQNSAIDAVKHEATTSQSVSPHAHLFAEVIEATGGLLCMSKTMPKKSPINRSTSQSRSADARPVPTQETVPSQITVPMQGPEVKLAPCKGSQDIHRAGSGGARISNGTISPGTIRLDIPPPSIALALPVCDNVPKRIAPVHATTEGVTTRDAMPLVPAMSSDIVVNNSALAPPSENAIPTMNDLSTVTGGGKQTSDSSTGAENTSIGNFASSRARGFVSHMPSMATKGVKKLAEGLSDLVLGEACTYVTMNAILPDTPETKAAKLAASCLQQALRLTYRSSVGKLRKTAMKRFKKPKDPMRSKSKISVIKSSTAPKSRTGSKTTVSTETKGVKLPTATHIASSSNIVNSTSTSSSTQTTSNSSGSTSNPPPSWTSTSPASILEGPLSPIAAPVTNTLTATASSADNVVTPATVATVTPTMVTITEETVVPAPVRQEERSWTPRLPGTMGMLLSALSCSRCRRKHRAGHSTRSAWSHRTDHSTNASIVSVDDTVTVTATPETATVSGVGSNNIVAVNADKVQQGFLVQGPKPYVSALSRADSNESTRVPSTCRSESDESTDSMASGPIGIPIDSRNKTKIPATNITANVKGITPNVIPSNNVTSEGMTAADIGTSHLYRTPVHTSVNDIVSFECESSNEEDEESDDEDGEEVEEDVTEFDTDALCNEILSRAGRADPANQAQLKQSLEAVFAARGQTVATLGPKRLQTTKPDLQENSLSNARRWDTATGGRDPAGTKQPKNFRRVNSMETTYPSDPESDGNTSDASDNDASNASEEIVPGFCAEVAVQTLFPMLVSESIEKTLGGSIAVEAVTAAAGFGMSSLHNAVKQTVTVNNAKAKFRGLLDTMKRANTPDNVALAAGSSPRCTPGEGCAGLKSPNGGVSANSGVAIADPQQQQDVVGDLSGNDVVHSSYTPAGAENDQVGSVPLAISVDVPSPAVQRSSQRSSRSFLEPRERDSRRDFEKADLDRRRTEPDRLKASGGRDSSNHQHSSSRRDSAQQQQSSIRNTASKKDQPASRHQSVKKDSSGRHHSSNARHSSGRPASRADVSASKKHKEHPSKKENPSRASKKENLSTNKYRSHDSSERRK